MPGFLKYWSSRNQCLQDPKHHNLAFLVKINSTGHLRQKYIKIQRLLFLKLHQSQNQTLVEKKCEKQGGALNGKQKKSAQKNNQGRRNRSDNMEKRNNKQ